MPPGGGGPAMHPHDPNAEIDQNILVRKKRERLSIKAQATSWALFYYLARAKPAELRSFLAELSAMPRDIPLEGAAVQAFYRAFNLDGSRESLDRFAQTWLEYIHNTSAAGIDIVLTQPKVSNAPSTSPTGPGIPGFGKP